MKTAYLILAHNNPNHLGELIKAVSSQRSTCFVHVDNKSEEQDFLHISGPDVLFSDKRVAVHWGDFSIVEATLILIRQALSHPRCFERLVLSSGVDYPLRSAGEIDTFFQEHPLDEFINIVQMPAKTERKPMWRLTTHRFSSPGDPFMKKLIRKIGAGTGFGRVLRTRAYQKHFRGLTPYAGDQWWALTRDACKYILDFIEKEPAIYKFFRNTRCPDEMFFQIILGNSFFKEKMCRNLTYADWGGIVSSHPARISEEHIHELFSSGLSFSSEDWYGPGPILFARKFSDDQNCLIRSVNQLIALREANYQISI